MISNEKLVEFIKADWEAKRRVFDTAMNSPFIATNSLFNQIGFQNDIVNDQLLLVPQTPSSFPQKPEPLLGK